MIDRNAKQITPSDADPVGSIRSVRPTDPALVAPVGGLYSYSGGTAKFVAMLHATSVADVGQSAHPGAYFLRPEKPPVHRLFSSTVRLYGAGGGSPGAAAAKAPPPLFTFLGPGADFSPPTSGPARRSPTGGPRRRPRRSSRSSAPTTRTRR